MGGSVMQNVLNSARNSMPTQTPPAQPGVGGGTLGGMGGAAPYQPSYPQLNAVKPQGGQPGPFPQPGMGGGFGGFGGGAPQPGMQQPFNPWLHAAMGMGQAADQMHGKSSGLGQLGQQVSPYGQQGFGQLGSAQVQPQLSGTQAPAQDVQQQLGGLTNILSNLKA